MQEDLELQIYREKLEKNNQESEVYMRKWRITSVVLLIIAALVYILDWLIQ